MQWKQDFPGRVGDAGGTNQHLQVKGEPGESQGQRVKWNTEDKKGNWEERDRGSQSLKVLPHHWVFFFDFQIAESYVSEQGGDTWSCVCSLWEKGPRLLPGGPLGKVLPRLPSLRVNLNPLSLSRSQSPEHPCQCL